jgi:hypothetical protein
MRIVFIYLLFVILLASCASAAQPTITGKGPVETQVTPSSGPVSPPAPDLGVPVIIMEKSGGIAGVHDKWTIYAGGQVVSAGQVVHTLTSDQVSSTLADIQKLGFFNMQADYSKASTCNDCFIITITVASAGNSKTVTGVEGDTHTPAEFLQVISDISSLVTP